MYDSLVVGAGLTGATVASILSREKKEEVLVVEKEKEIGGLCRDEYKDNVLIHKYGPHIFHTDNREVWDYLSNFTDWIEYQHKVKSYVNGNLVPFPINIETVNEIFGRDLGKEDFPHFLQKRSIHKDKIENAKDMAISQVGETLYKKFFKNYSKKQWGVYPDKLDKSIFERVPTRNSFDNRYFTDKYQGVPKDGYTEMIRNMLDQPNISILLGEDYRNIVGNVKFNKLYYTGPLDYYFDYEFGQLPYVTLDIEFEKYNTQHQDYAVINYPNSYDYTRIVEYKHMTSQKCCETIISKEYPRRADIDDKLFYPISFNFPQDRLDKYRKKAEESDTVFVGRLAEYKYYDMDEVVARALNLIEE